MIKIILNLIYSHTKWGLTQNSYRGRTSNISGIWIYNLLQFISKPGIHIQVFQLLFKRRNEIKTMNGKHSRVNTEGHRVTSVQVSMYNVNPE